MNRAASVLFWFALTIVVSVALYNTSYRVQDLRTQLRSLNASIENEQRSIHVLKAEWVFLANPARIEGAAHKYLGLGPTSPRQIADLGNMRQALAEGVRMVASAPAQPTPANNVKTAAAAKPTKVASLEVPASAATPQYVNTRMVIQHAAPPEAAAKASIVASSMTP